MTVQLERTVRNRDIFSYMAFIMKVFVAKVIVLSGTHTSRQEAGRTRVWRKWTSFLAAKEFNHPSHATGNKLWSRNGMSCCLRWASATNLSPCCYCLHSSEKKKLQGSFKLRACSCSLTYLARYHILENFGIVVEYIKTDQQMHQVVWFSTFHNGSYMFRQDSAILRERLDSCWVTSRFNVVHLLVCLYIYDNARYRNQKKKE
jgi:hypothetical protein